MGNTVPSTMPCALCPPKYAPGGAIEVSTPPASIRHMDVIDSARRPKPFGGLPSNTSSTQLRQIKLMEDHLDPQQRYLLEQRIDEKLPEALVNRELNLQRACFWSSWGCATFTTYSTYQFLKKLRIKLWMRSTVAAVGWITVAEIVNRFLSGRVCREEFKRYKEMREQVTLEVAGAEARRFMRYHRAPATQRLDPEYRLRLPGGIQKRQLAMDFTMRERWVAEKLVTQYKEWEKISTPVSEGDIPDPRQRFFSEPDVHLKTATIPADWYPPEIDLDGESQVIARFPTKQNDSWNKEYSQEVIEAVLRQVPLSTAGSTPQELQKKGLVPQDLIQKLETGTMNEEDVERASTFVEQMWREKIVEAVTATSESVIKEPLEQAKLRALDQCNALSEFGEPKGDLSDAEIEKARVLVYAAQKKTMEKMFPKLVEESAKAVKGQQEHTQGIASFVRDFEKQCREEWPDVPEKHLQTAIATALSKKVQLIKDIFEERHEKKRRRGEKVDPEDVSRHMLQQLQDKEKLLHKDTAHWLRHLAEMEGKVEEVRTQLIRSLRDRNFEQIDPSTTKHLEETLQKRGANGDPLTKEEQKELERVILGTNLFDIVYMTWKEEELMPIGTYTKLEEWYKWVEEYFWIENITRPLNLHSEVWQKAKIVSHVQAKATNLVLIEEFKRRRPEAFKEWKSLEEACEVRVKAQMLREKQTKYMKKVAEVSRKIEKNGDSWLGRLWGN